MLGCGYAALDENSRQADGSIYLLNPETNALAAVLEAPYMVDANGETSDAVIMELATWEDHYVLTVTADAGWVNADGRAFPVAVDPTITTNPSQVQVTYTPYSYIGRSGNYYSCRNNIHGSAMG